MVVAAPELGALAALFACAFLLMLYYAYGYTIGAWLQLLANAFRSVRTPSILGHRLSLSFVGDAIEGLDHDVRHALGAGIAATQRGFHYFMHWNAYLFTRLADTIRDLAGATEIKLEHALRVSIPNWVTHRLGSLAHRIDAIEHGLSALPHRARVYISEPIKIIYREAHAAKVAAIAHTLPGLGRLEREAGALAGRIGRLGREIEADAAKLSRLNRATVGAAATALVALALARLGLGSLRCSNTRKAAKQLCGIDTSLLDTLLADTLLIVGTVSLVEFAKGMQGVTAEVVGPIRRFWRAT